MKTVIIRANGVHSKSEDAMSYFIKQMARDCADANLNLRQARFYFDSCYIVSAIIACNGNVSKAAELLKMERGHIYRIMRERDVKDTEATADGTGTTVGEIQEEVVPPVVTRRRGREFPD
jgi:DNA-binding NtrC family response regulator